MIRLYASLSVAVLVFAGCATRMPEPAVEGSDYELVIAPNTEAKRFDVTMTSKSARPICVDVEEWPSLPGRMHFASSSVHVTAGNQDFPIKEENFGYCLGGCGMYRLKGGDALTGSVAFDQFAEAAFSLDEAPMLHFQPLVQFCVGGEKLISPGPDQ